MNYSDEINKKTIYYYTKLAYNIMIIYFENNIDITKEKVAKELIGIRELKAKEFDEIYYMAFEKFKNKYMS